MFKRGLSDSFQIYLWRSVDAPGTLYLAENATKAEALCRELVAEGYIVKVVHTATDTEYEIREGALVPVRRPVAERSPAVGKKQIARPPRQTVSAPA